MQNMEQNQKKTKIKTCQNNNTMNNRTPSHHLHLSPNKKDKNTNKEHTDTKEKTKKRKRNTITKTHPWSHQGSTLRAVFPSPTETPVFFSGLLVEFGWLLQRRGGWKCMHFCSSLAHRTANPENKSNSGLQKGNMKREIRRGSWRSELLDAHHWSGLSHLTLRRKKSYLLFCDYYFFVFMFSIFCLEFFRKRVLLARKCVWEDLIFLKGGGLRLSHFIFRYFLMCVL